MLLPPFRRMSTKLHNAVSERKRERRNSWPAYKADLRLRWAVGFMLGDEVIDSEDDQQASGLGGSQEKARC